MAKTNIVLIGAMKSVNNRVAKILSDETNLSYFDSDDYIEYMERLKLGCIVADHSVDYFLKLESKHLKCVKDFTNAILTMSGTVILNKENIDLLRQNSVLVLLTADEQKTKFRIKNDKSFVLRKYMLKNINSVLAAVSKASLVADMEIDTTNKGPIKVAEEIMKRFKIGN